VQTLAKYPVYCAGSTVRRDTGIINVQPVFESPMSCAVARLTEFEIGRLRELGHKYAALTVRQEKKGLRQPK
jgi:hypothetical protein